MVIEKYLLNAYTKCIRLNDTFNLIKINVNETENNTRIQ
jgi:hypothetical protein